MRRTKMSKATALRGATEWLAALRLCRAPAEFQDVPGRVVLHVSELDFEHVFGSDLAAYVEARDR